MKNFEGRVAAITGAGSGIGKALAVNLAERGAQLALSDIDADGLADTVRACSSSSHISSRLLDVADRQAVHRWAEQVVTDHGHANLIINNAGVALSASVEGAEYDDLDWLMNINYWGVVHGTKAFLPALKAAGEGHIVNISSVFGLVGLPSQSAYNASKFAVRGFTDALRIELDIERCGVSATTVHPGGIKTNIARSARLGRAAEHDEDRARFVTDFDKLARTTPERAAEQIIEAVRRNRRRALIGPDAALFDIVSRLPAGVSQRMIALAARRSR